VLLVLKDQDFKPIVGIANGYSNYYPLQYGTKCASNAKQKLNLQCCCDAPDVWHNYWLKRWHLNGNRGDEVFPSVAVIVDSPLKTGLPGQSMDGVHGLVAVIKYAGGNDWWSRGWIFRAIFVYGGTIKTHTYHNGRDLTAVSSLVGTVAPVYRRARTAAWTSCLSWCWSIWHVQWLDDVFLAF